jgi:predicted secreted hydrolase
VTFFRSRVDATQRMQSRFAAKQLVFAHAAVTDVQGRKLLARPAHRARRLRHRGGCRRRRRITLRDWSLRREGECGSRGFRPATSRWTCAARPPSPCCCKARQGLSRKGPDAAQASYYYSLPQLAVAGRLSLQGRNFDVTGKAWLDHEWSEALMHPRPSAGTGSA